MSKYYLEIEDFKYSKNQLLKYQGSIKEWRPNFHYASKGIDSFENKWFDYYPDITDPVFNDLILRINLNIEEGSFKFVTLLAGGNLPYHIDPNRECVFMIPLTEDNSGIKWIDEKGSVLYSHIYRCPTVINAKIMHGVPFNDKTRSFLQINLPCSWEYLIENKDKIFIS
jgi:hypothetical protein